MTRCRRPFVIALVTTVVAVFAVYTGAAFGVFGHCCPRINANETAAIATLRNIHSAQRQFHGVVGGFGTFGEPSGAVPIRGTDRLLDPPVLSGAFRTPLADGSIIRSGFRFRIDLTGETWRVFAWPVERSRFEQRTFFADGSAECTVVATEDDRHEGDRGPETTVPVAGTTNADGNFWRVVR